MKALRILVLEDDAMIGMLLAAILEEMGHTVCAIEATETDAVSAAARYRPDLMIVDARLGNGSGLAAMDEVLRTGFIPHFFISGNIAKVTALRPGAVVLEKPFRDIQLARTIELALASGAEVLRSPA
ncbi:MAG: response regulator [Beijerinckiaceae bacterium]|nr:response regulator [Beijerinckiaceae bacterium]